MPSPYGALGEQLGDPRAANPTLDQLRMALARAPGPGGPMPDPADIQRYLSMTGIQYPAQLPQINPQAWAQFLATARPSINIEDRRGFVPGAWRR